MSTGRSTPPTPSPHRGGRPRRADVESRLSAAALRLLRERGPAAVTVEAVAAESGLAKTTIYRRYANRAELLEAVLSSSVGDPEALPDGSVRDKIRFALREVWRQMADVLGPGGLGAIVMDADPQFTQLFRAALAPYDAALVARIEADRTAGLLRPDVDADGVVSLFLGAYLGELVRRGGVDEEWLDRCLEMMWRTLAPAGD